MVTFSWLASTYLRDENDHRRSLQGLDAFLLKL